MQIETENRDDIFTIKRFIELSKKLEAMLDLIQNACSFSKNELKDLKKFKKSLKFDIDLHVENLKAAIKKIDINLIDLILFGGSRVDKLFEKIPIEIKEKIHSIELDEPKDTDETREIPDNDAEHTKMACFLLMHLLIDRCLISDDHEDLKNIYPMGNFNGRVGIVLDHYHHNTSYFKELVEMRSEELSGVKTKKSGKKTKKAKSGYELRKSINL